MAAETRRMQGEVSEREDLLDGRVRVDLDGRTDGEAGGWTVVLSVGWRRGREGEVALDEGELTLVDGNHELFASLDTGTAEPDEDTGAARIRATFAVDDSEGDWPEAVERIACTFEAGNEEWSGELRLG